MAATEIRTTTVNQILQSFNVSVESHLCGTNGTANVSRERTSINRCGQDREKEGMRRVALKERAVQSWKVEPLSLQACLELQTQGGAVMLVAMRAHMCGQHNHVLKQQLDGHFVLSCDAARLFVEHATRGDVSDSCKETVQSHLLVVRELISSQNIDHPSELGANRQADSLADVANHDIQHHLEETSGALFLVQSLLGEPVALALARDDGLEPQGRIGSTHALRSHQTRKLRDEEAVGLELVSIHPPAFACSQLLSHESVEVVFLQLGAL